MLRSGVDESEGTLVFYTKKTKLSSLMEKPMPELTIEPRTTALLLLDLQRGIVGRETAPHAAMDVVERSANLAAAFRSKGAVVIYVRVDFSDMIKVNADRSLRDPNAPPPPPSASEIVPQAGWQPGDPVIVKRHWGAFCGTNLEEDLHQRGIRTVVLTGVSTNYAVESTARAAVERGFDVIVVEDATSARDADAHRFAHESIFPLLGRVRSTEQVLAAF
jgi:nicotinamidase-related amidase